MIKPSQPPRLWRTRIARHAHRRGPCIGKMPSKNSSCQPVFQFAPDRTLERPCTIDRAESRGPVRPAQRRLSTASGRTCRVMIGLCSDRTPMKSKSAFSAGVVVVRRKDGGWRVLVLRSYRNWDFPKGTVEPNETPLDAAVRETAEESSITDLASARSRATTWPKPPATPLPCRSRRNSESPSITSGAG